MWVHPGHKTTFALFRKMHVFFFFFFALQNCPSSSGIRIFGWMFRWDRIMTSKNATGELGSPCPNFTNQSVIFCVFFSTNLQKSYLHEIYLYLKHDIIHSYPDVCGFLQNPLKTCQEINYLSLVFTFIQGEPRNPNFNPYKVRTDHIQRMWRQTNERKTEEYMAHITKDRFKEHLKIAKEFVWFKLWWYYFQLK